MPEAPYGAEHLKALPIQDADLLIAARDVQEPLLVIWREGQRDDRPRGRAHFSRDEGFLHERSVRFEHLKAIVRPVGHVHEVVVGNLHVVREIELFRGRPLVGPGL